MVQLRLNCANPARRIEKGNAILLMDNWFADGPEDTVPRGIGEANSCHPAHRAPAASCSSWLLMALRRQEPAHRCLERVRRRLALDSAQRRELAAGVRGGRGPPPPVALVARWDPAALQAGESALP